MLCGDKIRKKRKELNLTQQDLADKVGLKFATISKYEKNEISIPAKRLRDIAVILGVSVDYLLGDTLSENPKQYLEKTLTKYALSENEYEKLITELIESETFDLSLLTSKDPNLERIQNAYNEIFNVYINYLKAKPLKSEIEDINVIQEKNKVIDEKFINMLKTLNKRKILYGENDDTFFTNDIPRQLPVLGKISAGLPIFANENIEDYKYAPSGKILEDYDYFYLKVQGDSMNLKFPNGCLLLVQKQPTLEKGEIGVFRINGDDATVKRYKEENGLIILEPMSSNPTHEAQIYDPKKIKVEIIGKAISYMGDL